MSEETSHVRSLAPEDTSFASALEQARVVANANLGDTEAPPPTDAALQADMSDGLTPAERINLTYGEPEAS